nr:MAG TPA: hypothetical protein [Caudoviricetes sp.]
MPVQNPGRAQLNIGPAALTPSSVDLAVGVGAADPVRNKKDLILGALEQFYTGFDAQMKDEGAKAAVRGALDATTAMDAAGERDENVRKQNIFLRDSYEDGYLSAAASQELASWKVEALNRSQKAAQAGLTDEEFRQQEQQHVQKLTDKLGTYLPDMPEQAAVAVLQQIQSSAAANVAAFQKGRAEFAQVQADRALDKNLTASGQEFYARLNNQQPEAAKAALMGGMQAILAAGHLDKDKKLDKVKGYLVSVAQNTQDPMVIDQLQKLASEELGVNSVDVNKALYSEFQRAGNQVESQVRFQMSDMLTALDGASPEAQEQGMRNIRDELIKWGTLGVLAPGTQMDMWEKAEKLRETSASKYALQAAVANNQPTTVLAGMFKGDLDKARNQILAQFPDTAEGNVGLLQYAASSKDAWAGETAQKRLSGNLSATLNTLDQLGEDGQISQENQLNIATWVQAYTSSNALGKNALLEKVPEDLRGIVQRAAAQGPNNASNIMLDDIRRLSENKASGRYNSLQPNPSDKMLDASGAANWFSFGSTADAQRREARAAMEDEYRYLYRKNPEALVGKSAEDISTMLAGNIESRKLEVEVSGKPRHIYLPAGTSLETYMGDYKGSREQFTTALQGTVQAAVDAAVDPSKLDRVVVQAGTAGNKAQNFTATVFTKDGTFQNISVDMGKVQDLAQVGYNEALAGDIKEGEKALGARPATFYDHDNGRTVQLLVDGRNNVGVQPDLFSEVLANTMQFEGYRSKKGNGSVGFGLHVNSGMPVPQTLTPEWAVSVLKTSMESQYLPAVQNQMRGNGIAATPEAVKLLVDLNYHGGNGSSGPVVEAMAQVRKARKNAKPGPYQYPISEAEGNLWQTLRRQPAYKQAQKERKQYLEQNLRDWIYSSKF